MKPKKNVIKRLVSLLLCSAICVVAAAAADNWQYSKWTATVTGVSNIKYHGRTAITASKGLVRSTATILSTNTSALPAGYPHALCGEQRELCRRPQAPAEQGRAAGHERLFRPALREIWAAYYRKGKDL